MKISKIKKLNNDKYKIILENGEVINTYDDVILSTNILYTKELTDEQLEKIETKNDYYSLYNKAIKYISKRLRSEYEIEEYLNKNNNLKIDIKKIINDLKNNGYINDLNFAKAYIYDRFNLYNDGPYKIKKDLLSYKIDEAIIDENINNLKEEDIKSKVEKYVSKKVRLDHKHSISIIKSKLKLELYNLGYDNSIIEEVLSNIKYNSNIEKEFNNIYNKLSKKYSDFELENKIKQKLYQKGYSFEEINNQLKRLGN